MKGGGNAWTDHVHKYAKDHDISYMCALSQAECSAEYKAGKKGKKKALTQKKERENMGAEDKDVPAITKQEKTKESKAKFAKNKLALDKKREEQENITMAIEDVDAPAPAVPAVKKRGRPAKYATEAEKKKAKSDKTVEAFKRRQLAKRTAKEEARNEKKELAQMAKEDKKKSRKKMLTGGDDAFGNFFKNTFGHIGDPYKAVGVNPLTMGYDLGHDVIGPALFGKGMSGGMSPQDIGDLVSSLVFGGVSLSILCGLYQEYRRWANQNRGRIAPAPLPEALAVPFHEYPQMADVFSVLNSNRVAPEDIPHAIEIGRGMSGGAKEWEEELYDFLEYEVDKYRNKGAVVTKKMVDDLYLKIYNYSLLPLGQQQFGDVVDFTKEIVKNTFKLPPVTHNPFPAQGKDEEEEEKDDDFLHEFDTGAGRTGGHWTKKMMPHLTKELANYQSIAHHLGSHLKEQGHHDPRDVKGLRHFSAEADRISKMLNGEPFYLSHQV